MSAELDTAAELRKHYYGGKQAMHVLERCTTVPREPRDRRELMSALSLLSSLIEGYAPTEDERESR